MIYTPEQALGLLEQHLHADSWRALQAQGSNLAEIAKDRGVQTALYGIEENLQYRKNLNMQYGHAAYARPNAPQAAADPGGPPAPDPGEAVRREAEVSDAALRGLFTQLNAAVSSADRANRAQPPAAPPLATHQVANLPTYGHPQQPYGPPSYPMQGLPPQGPTSYPMQYQAPAGPAPQYQTVGDLRVWMARQRIGSGPADTTQPGQPATGPGPAQDNTNRGAPRR
ncbi:hypothetical protein ACN28G_12975 [Micromonospora sp. WMMA1923]|uniref:hypothetical protein n=1 Tax=Micromonospora sp. WMMA1923 TaxID=3404125 RepID=UPI003B9618C0